MLSFIFSYFLIPAFTLFLARGISPFSTNFSSLCREPERQTEFFLWCLVTGGYFFFSLRALMRSLFRPRLAFLPAAGTALYLICVLLPYRPAIFPVLSVIHVAGTFCATVLLLLCLYTLAFRLRLLAPRRSMRCLLELSAASLFCLFSWMLSGIINASMEICIVITAAIQIRRLSAPLHLP